MSLSQGKAQVTNKNLKTLTQMNNPGTPTPTQNRINALLVADPDTVSPEIAAAALAEFTKQQDEAAKALMVRRLSSTVSATNEVVGVLRDARKAEKNAKTLLDTVAAAEEAFKANGDWKAYNTAKDAAWTKFHRGE